MNTSEERLVSIDTMRGFLMFWLIGGEHIVSTMAQLFDNSAIQWLASQMVHVSWNGANIYDMLFPSFLFVSGMTYPLSLRKMREREESIYKIYYSVIKRGLILVLLGCIYNGLLGFNFSEMRYASVLGRIGIAWMLAAIIFTAIKDKRKCIVIGVVVLIAYWLVLRYIPAPDYPNAELFTREGSLAGYIDRQFLPGVLYEGTMDPEGIMSTFPAVITALFGMLFGEFILTDTYLKSIKKKLLITVASGVVLVLIGLAWNIVFPINKRLWSSSFVCYLAGIDILVFTGFYVVVDLLKFQKWAFLFQVIGSNSIFAYMISRTGCIAPLSGFLFSGVEGCFPEIYVDLMYWCGYFATMWILLFILYKKRFFIRV